jgi:hypothetical protein
MRSRIARRSDSLFVAVDFDRGRNVAALVTGRSRGRGWSADKAGEVTVRAIDPVAGKVLRG